MKKVSLILVLIFLSLSACGSEVKNQILDWKEFVSEDGRFKAVFPLTPEQSIRTSPLGNGKIQHPKVEVSLPQMNFSIYYGDIPDLKDLNLEELKEYYIYLQNTTLKLNNSQLIDEREVTIDEKRGYEFVESRNNKLVKYRLLLIKNRLYQLKTEIDSDLKSDNEAKENMEKFFNSFQIIEN
jgi:hypothetical protein